jgi:carboxyl-terminal processing protease
MKLSIKEIIKYFLLIGLVVHFQSCQEKEEPNPIDGSNASINKWSKSIMDQIYYWLDDMRNPISINSDPTDYFESLLFRPTDRYSAIFPDYQELINSLQGVSKESGYEFSLVQQANTENVLGVITYVKKGSPADLKGLMRSDIFFEINGTTLTTSNYQTALRAIRNDHSLRFRRYDAELSEYIPQEAVNLETIVISENPNFLDTVFQIENQKIGYVVYHFFAPGTDSNPNGYDAEMDQIFGKLKSEGINHLILDFRYNSGGFTGSAVNLASLIGPNVGTDDIFYKTKFNSFVMSFDQFKDVKTMFRSKSQNLGPTLSGNRVYVLTSSRTASASELIINGLKPYMDVFLIGSTTTGKNTANTVLEDEDNPDNKYGLYPTISKLFNKNDESDFINGFIPDVSANELSQRVLLPLGDTNEYLLSLAIDHILGHSSDRRILVDRQEVGSSLQGKIRSGVLIDDMVDIKELIKK